MIPSCRVLSYAFDVNHEDSMYIAVVSVPGFSQISLVQSNKMYADRC